MANLQYSLAKPLGHKATLGLIVLQMDETLEPEFTSLLQGEGLATYVSRVPSGADVTPDTLNAMKSELPASAALFPPSLEFDAIGYACTSGATMIGPDAVARLVAEGAKTRAVTNPLSAAQAGFAALGVSRIGLVTPYVASVANPMCDTFEAGGITVTKAVSFGEQSEAQVARIDPASTFDAAMVVGQSDCEAVFLSCTNLRSVGIIAELEDALGKPVLSSNLALAWHMAALSGAPVAPNAPGQLIQTLRDSA